MLLYQRVPLRLVWCLARSAPTWDIFEGWLRRKWLLRTWKNWWTTTCCKNLLRDIFIPKRRHSECQPQSWGSPGHEKVGSPILGFLGNSLSPTSEIPSRNLGIHPELPIRWGSQSISVTVSDCPVATRSVLAQFLQFTVWGSTREAFSFRTFPWNSLKQLPGLWSKSYLKPPTSKYVI